MTEPRSYTAYVSCLSGNEINVFSGDDVAGTLEHVQTIALPGRGKGLVGRGLPLAHAPNRRRLYAAVYGDQTSSEKDLVDSYAIDPVTGLLTHISSTSVMAQLSHISVDRTGGFLLGASEPSGLVVAYPIGDHGHVQPRASGTVVPLRGAHQILTDYTNRYAYIPSLSSDVLVSLLFDERTGSFTANSPPEIALQTGAGCRHLAFHPNRRYMYLLNQKDGSLVCYRLDPSTGGLCELMHTSILPEGFKGSPWGAQIKVSPKGDRLFASERRSDTLSVWDIDQNNGRLSDRHIVPTPKNPRCFDVTPNGCFVVLSALKGDCVALFDVSEKSAPPQHVMELPTGGEPGWVEIL
ncbi:lactonase family protein [Roseobacter weihaiensis]|uniref:lactonase family protein n=1 Tax=Roseobacter weihaiensis TaxID=2763262 RepID=UPI001D0A7531|nr:beta-propeller fold lactonase family protein [Roseobacter sp. H9]